MSQGISIFHHALLQLLLIEKHLISAFPGKGPIRIYRGLPREYRKSDPASSQVKAEFTHLPTLKALAAEKIFFNAYDGIEHPKGAKVTVFTYVLPDGLGDVISSLEVVSILKHRFPSLHVCSVIVFPKNKDYPSVLQEADEAHLVRYQNADALLGHQEALKAMRTSDFVLQIPTFYPRFKELQASVSAIDAPKSPPSWGSIGEYGFIESQWHHPTSGNRAMGLHFLEKGIFIKAPIEDQSFSDLQNGELLQWLFGTLHPSEEAIQQYRESHYFYLGYLSQPIAGGIYLHALQKRHENDPKPIDICSPNLHWLIDYAQMEPSILEGASIELYFTDKVAVLTGGRKKIRIFCPKQLSPQDFQLLVHLSDPFVAVRGNLSFSEVIAEGKPFFFDARSHSIHFLKDLIALAENRIRSKKATLAVLKGMLESALHSKEALGGEWVDESYFQVPGPWREAAFTIGEALQDPECLTGFQRLSQIIREEYSLNQFLCCYVQRELCHRSYSSVKAIENAILQKFTSGFLSLEAANGELKKKLAYDKD